LPLFLPSVDLPVIGGHWISHNIINLILPFRSITMNVSSLPPLASPKQAGVVRACASNVRSPSAHYGMFFALSRRHAVPGNVLHIGGIQLRSTAASRTEFIEDSLPSHVLESLT
jgi:hypothetical protein